MVTLQKSGDSAVKFVFTDSDHYLYGNGEIEVPVNSLLLVIDESEMVTFKKISGDPFLSFRADNSNLGTKAVIEQFYKDNMVGSTGGGGGGGVTSGQVQSMIDESISGKADTSAVTAVDNALSAYSATTDARIAEDEEVTAAALNDLQENKADTSAVTQEISAATSGKVNTSAITSSVTSASTDSQIPTAKATYDAIQAGGGGSANVIELTQAQYDALSGSVDPSAIYVITDATAYDPSTKVDTSAITTSITSGSTDSEVAGAKAVYDTLGGLKFVQCTQAEYDALVSGGTVDSSTIYFITNVVS